MNKSRERELLKDLTNFVNAHSIDNELNMPDFILGAFLLGVLKHLKDAVSVRDEWFGFRPFERSTGGDVPPPGNPSQITISPIEQNPRPVSKEEWEEREKGVKKD